MRRGLLQVACVVFALQMSCKALTDAMNASIEANRTVTLVVEGAVFGPVDASGRTWDGGAPSGREVGLILELAANVYPPGRVATALGVTALATQLADGLMARVNEHFAAPDALGTVSISTRDRTVEHALPKRGNTFTPVWSVQIGDVPIHQARVVITFKDRDLTADRMMAKVVLRERELLAAEESGDVFVVDTSRQTGGAVQRVLISVYR